MKKIMKIKKILSLMLVLSLMVLSVPVVNAADGANSAASTASVTNVVPVASSPVINSSAAINLTESTTTNVTVTATVTDNNGCQDIDSVAVVLYLTTVTLGSGCSADTDDCYITTASVGGGNACDGAGDLSASYTTTIAVQYFATAGGWSATVTPSDEAAGTAATDTETMNELTALSVTATIPYGTLALGGATADTTAFDTTVTNTGNKASIGVQVNSGAATAMTCTWGTVPVGNEKYHATSTTAYASKTALTAVAATVADVAATKTTSAGAGTTDTVGWGLQLPADGVGGSCTGTVVFTAS